MVLVAFIPTESSTCSPHNRRHIADCGQSKARPMTDSTQYAQLQSVSEQQALGSMTNGQKQHCRVINNPVQHLPSYLFCVWMFTQSSDVYKQTCNQRYGSLKYWMVSPSIAALVTTVLGFKTLIRCTVIFIKIWSVCVYFNDHDYHHVHILLCHHPHDHHG